MVVNPRRFHLDKSPLWPGSALNPSVHNGLHFPAMAPAAKSLMWLFFRLIQPQVFFPTISVIDLYVVTRSAQQRRVQIAFCIKSTRVLTSTRAPLCMAKLFCATRT